MQPVEHVKNVLGQCLQLDVSHWGMQTPLLGAVPELDSMTIVNVITSLEEQFGIVIEDDEISAELFESLGSLAQFITDKSATV